MNRKECRRIAKMCRCSMLAVTLAHWSLRSQGKGTAFPDHEYRDLIRGAKARVRALGKK